MRQLVSERTDDFLGPKTRRGNCARASASRCGGEMGSLCGCASVARYVLLCIRKNRTGYGEGAI